MSELKPEFIMGGDGLYAGIDEDDAAEINFPCMLISLPNEGDFAKMREVLENWDNISDGWISVDSAEDLPMQQDVICWDGCNFSIDYADMDSDSGTHYMANGTEVEAYKLLAPPKATS